MQLAFDRLAKDLLVSTVGQASVGIAGNRELAAAPLFLDVWFEPDRERLGLLAPFGMIHRIASEGPCAFECFHRAPNLEEVLSSLRKAFFLRRKPTLPGGPDEPWLWIIAGGRPTQLIAGFALSRATDWPSGVYIAAPALRLRLIVTSELPVTPDTLLLRCLGAGKTLRQALRELRENGPDHPVTRIVEPLVVRLHIEKRSQPDKREPEDEEFVMETRDIYEVWRQRIEAEARSAGHNAGLVEGHDAGLAEGQSRALFAILEARGLEISAEQAARVRACRDSDTLQVWLRRAATVERVDDVFV